MTRLVLDAFRDTVELAALGAFVAMVALVAQALGA